MLFQELNFFVQGWRGFLVGQPRGWHAHHRSEAQGQREGWILPRETLQVGQLRRAASLTVELLARGGRLWGFGFGGGHQTPGFTWWARVTPGVLSNSFFARLRRLPSVRQLRRLILLRPRRRKVRPRVKRRSRRVGHHRRRGTLGLHLGRARLTSRVLRFRVWGQHLRRGLKTQLQGSRFPDLLDQNRFTRLGYQPRSFFSRSPVRRTHRGGWRMWAPRKVTQAIRKQIIQAHRRRRIRASGVVRLGWSSGVTPLVGVRPARVSFLSPRYHRGYHRGGRRRQPRLRLRPRWGTPPGGLPTGVLLGGSAGQTLHREVTRGGTPLILVSEIEVVPGVGSFYPVWWNNASLEGPRHLWSHLEALAHRGGLFRLFWTRLTCLAEW